MTTKANSFRIAPLQRLAAEPITDPNEQAALDEQRRSSRGVVPMPEVSPPVLELWQKTSAANRHALLTELAAHLSSEQQLDLLGWLTNQVPSDVLAQLVGQWRDQVGNPVAEGNADGHPEN
jgi:hypothetical protein